MSVEREIGVTKSNAVRMKVKGEMRYFGTFDTVEEANEVARTVRKEFNITTSRPKRVDWRQRIEELKKAS